MTVYKCPQCHKSMSVRADACPYCGYDMRSYQKNMVREHEREDKEVEREKREDGKE